jgi:hypothetical protein
MKLSPQSVCPSVVELHRFDAAPAPGKNFEMAYLFLLFFTQEGTPHILRFDFCYTVIIPAAPQETVEEAEIEPGTAVLQSGLPSRALAN